MPAPRQSSIRVVALASLVGTTIEWYDFFLYGTAAALVLNKLFFPTFDPLSGTLISLATYSVGFVAACTFQSTTNDSAPYVASSVEKPSNSNCLIRPLSENAV